MGAEEAGGAQQPARVTLVPSEMNFLQDAPALGSPWIRPDGLITIA